MLSQIEIDNMQDLIETTFPNTGVIKRYTNTNDGFGGFTQSESTVVTVNCAFYINSTKDVIVADGQQNQSTFTILFPVGTDITNKDRVSIGSRVFEVIQVQSRSYELVIRVEVVETL